VISLKNVIFPTSDRRYYIIVNVSINILASSPQGQLKIASMDLRIAVTLKKIHILEQIVYHVSLLIITSTKTNSTGRLECKQKLDLKAKVGIMPTL